MLFKSKHVTVQPYMFLSSYIMMLHDIMLPQILLDTACRRNYSTTICENINSNLFTNEEYQIQKQAALWLTAIQSFQAALSLVAVLFLGPITEVIGIRKAMFLTPFCTGIQHIICIILTRFAYPFHPSLLLLTAPFLSLCGSYSGNFFFATSYVAAVTSEKDRTFQIVIVDAFFSVAVCVASFTSGYILENLGFTWAYSICLILVILNGVCILLFVKDIDASFRAVSNEGTDFIELSQQKHCKMKDNNKRDSYRDGISNVVSDEETESDKRKDNNNVDDSKGDNSYLLGSKLEPSRTTGRDHQTYCNRDEKEEDSFVDDHNIVNSNCKNIVDTEISAPVTRDGTRNDNPGTTELANIDNNPSISKISLFFAQVNPLGQFKYLVTLLRQQNRTKIVFLLLLASFTSIITYVGEYNIIVLFIRNHPFSFDAIDVGHYISFQNLIVAVVGGLVMNVVFQRCFVFSDLIAITFALTSHGVYLILLGFSTTKSMLYSIQTVMAVGALDYPILRSALTKSVDSYTHATLLTAMATLEQVGFLCAGLTSPLIYAKLLSLHRGAAFFFLSMFPTLASVATGIYLWKEKNLKLKEKSVEEAIISVKEDQEI